MTRISRSRSPHTRNTTLAIRTREPLAQKDIIAPVAGDSDPTQADRCPYPGCSSDLPHQHSTAESSKAPSVEEYQKSGEAIREHWTENQKRRIAENEAVLRQLADIEPKVANLSIEAHLPRGNDLTVQEQIAIIHGGATPENDDPTTGSRPKDPQEVSHSGSNGKDLAPGLTAEPSPRYQNRGSLNSNPQCKGPCPIQFPHNQGFYLQQGQVPRTFNARWGYSDPPRRIWEAWVRVENGTASSGDEIEVDGFASSHSWAGP